MKSTDLTLSHAFVAQSQHTVSWLRISGGGLATWNVVSWCTGTFGSEPASMAATGGTEDARIRNLFL